MNLERGDAREGARRRADLGGEVGERREVVAEHRGGVGEAAPCELHTVARVPRESDHDPFALFDYLAHGLQAFSAPHPLTNCRWVGLRGRATRSPAAEIGGARASRRPQSAKASYSFSTLTALGPLGPSSSS